MKDPRDVYMQVLAWMDLPPHPDETVRDREIAAADRLQRVILAGRAPERRPAITSTQEVEQYRHAGRIQSFMRGEHRG